MRDPKHPRRFTEEFHGGRCFKTSGADIRTKVEVIAANARRYPVSAQCEILGVARATYYYMVKREDAEPKLDPLEDEVVSIFHENRGRYGATRAPRAQRGHR